MTGHTVLIAGGGPTGMMLAGELALAGVDMAIVERRPSQDLVGSRSGGLLARITEVLDQRSIANRFLSEGNVGQVGIGLAGSRWTSATFPPARLRAARDRTISNAYWPAGSASWGCRSIAAVT